MISVLCVTYEVGLSCCTIFPVLLIESAFRLQVEFDLESDACFVINRSALICVGEEEPIPSDGLENLECSQSDL